MSATVQGSISELIALAERIHHTAFEDEDVPRMITTIRIEDSRGAPQSLMEEATTPA